MQDDRLDVLELRVGIVNHVDAYIGEQFRHYEREFESVSNTVEGIDTKLTRWR